MTHNCITRACPYEIGVLSEFCLKIQHEMYFVLSNST